MPDVVILSERESAAADESESKNPFVGKNLAGKGILRPRLAVLGFAQDDKEDLRLKYTYSGIPARISPSPISEFWRFWKKV